MNPDLIALQASEFIAEALPIIRKDMGGKSPEDPIGVIRTSEMLSPIKGDQLADLAALALRMLATLHHYTPIPTEGAE